MNKLPDCMMPDGADPCEGYKTLYREVEYLRWENVRLRHHLQTAVDRINDVLLDDDGQAYKEAEKWLPYIKRCLE